METRPIKKNDYGKVLDLDKKVFPTDNPVTIEILNQWYQNNPEFGIIFEENNRIKGMCIVIPLNKEGWEKLILGNLSEADLNSETIFNSSRDNKIGIHIYHIEKFNNSKKIL